MRLQRINYGNGGIGVLNLLDAQHQYQQALLGFVRAEAQRYQDTIQLLIAMGGGLTGDGGRSASSARGDVFSLIKIVLFSMTKSIG